MSILSDIAAILGADSKRIEKHQATQAQAVADFRDGVSSTLRQIKAGTQSAQWTVGTWTFRTERTVCGLWVWSAVGRETLTAKTMIAIDGILSNAGVQGLQLEETPCWVGEVSRASLITVDPDGQRGQYA